MSLIHRMRPTTGSHDPFWDLDGKGVKRYRLRQQVVGAIALILAIVACGLSTAAWIREVEPIIKALGS